MKTAVLNRFLGLARTLALVALFPAPVAAREAFLTPDNGSHLGLWRITNDPSVRDWANYHNTQCWSPDGRYVCYTHWAPRNGSYSDGNVEVHVFDFHRDEGRLIERGFNPRWATHHNWLFYVRIGSAEGPRQTAVEVRWLDLDTGRHVTLATGVENLGETCCDDRWLYGAKRFRGETPEFVTVRIPIQPHAAPEELPAAVGSQWQPNPRYPVFFTRQDHKQEAFGATRWFYDLDGGNKRMAVPTLQQCHMAWLGNGEYLLMGNGLVRGRRWNEPFPSNVEILAGVTVGDISPCGRSGRYACGDSAVADLRSGDGWHFLEPLSMICYPAKAGDQSTNYDADPKGSPDGTKICFVSNYDLKDGPLTYLDGDQEPRAGVLRVKSAQDFPASGLLTIRSEVVHYQRKTATTFEGLTRAVYETGPASLRSGLPVTSFDARLMTDAQWDPLPGAPHSMRKVMDAGSPLLRQRQTDVYVAVVRKPDRPFLRLAGDAVQLIPGEEHFETRGYHLLKDGERFTAEPLTPGASLPLRQPAEYSAIAVEWCGLESEPSLPLRLGSASELHVLPSAPGDFSWTQEQWRIGSREATEAQARNAPTALRELIHRHDGVIQRGWYRDGMLQRRHDLNAQGEATRRVDYEQGRPARREYYRFQEGKVSEEIFDASGFLTEFARYRRSAGEPVEAERWWFDGGMPVRHVVPGDEHVKQNARWISTRTGKSWTK